MKLTIKLYADLREYTKNQGTLIQEFNEGSTVEDVLKQLNISKDEVKIIMVNGRRVEPEKELHDGDRIGVFPAIAGG